MLFGNKSVVLVTAFYLLFPILVLTQRSSFLAIISSFSLGQPGMETTKDESLRNRMCGLQSAKCVATTRRPRIAHPVSFQTGIRRFPSLQQISILCLRAPWAVQEAAPCFEACYFLWVEICHSPISKCGLQKILGT